MLEALVRLFPEAEISTLLHVPGELPEGLSSRVAHTSFLQRVPGIERRYRHFLPAMPAAIASLEIPDCDLVISSSHCVAKGLRVPRGARHLSYVHAPMRYMWERFDDYFGPGRASRPVRAAATLFRRPLQLWDVRSARGVDRFIANSHHIAAQVRALYGRDCAVVHPPVELERFLLTEASIDEASSREAVSTEAGATVPDDASPADREPLTSRRPEASVQGRHGSDGYFLWFGAFAPYKRLDVALEAFRRLPHTLWVAGSGPGEDMLRRGAPPNVRFLGRVGDDEVPHLLANARALLFTGVEDFGIVPLEAQATGRPVIALAHGGALETVTEETGVFFDTATPAALASAVRSFVSREGSFDPAAARANARRFSEEAFAEGMRREIAAVMEDQ